MIFELEDSGDEQPGEDYGEVDQRKWILPLNEPVQERPLSPRRFRDANSAGLPQSFASLRPSSLPVPSLVRPPLDRTSLLSDSQASGSNVKIPLELPPKPKRKVSAVTSEERPLQPHEAEILRLVAAGTPSHRGAWTRDSEAWKIFERRQKSRSQSGADSPAIAEEGEDAESGEPKPDDFSRRYPNAEDSDDESSDRKTEMSTSFKIAFALHILNQVLLQELCGLNIDHLTWHRLYQSLSSRFRDFGRGEGFRPSSRKSLRMSARVPLYRPPQC